MRKFLFSIGLAVATCFVLVFTANPSLSINSTQQNIILYQQEAESVLIADMPNNLIAQAGTKPVRFVAILTGENIFPSAVSTQANGAIGAVLLENRLVVRGSFGNLSSSLRDYATDPVSPPNPKITSGVHIHKGSSQENGAFQYALSVESNSNGLGGSLKGEYTLTSEQLQELNSGKLYVDLHTKANRAGELRGILTLDK